ncbi:MAG: DUF3592 domain-containing protein [Woeseiaceae bacterium]|nr:DUF3592 domain-containing protein [Woeseiaceae bacterium]
MKFEKSFGFQTGPASPRTTVIGMAFVGSIILIGTVYLTRFTLALDAGGLRTQGEVVSYIETSDGMNIAVFQFVAADGKVYQVRNRTRSSIKRYDIGEKVPIIYEPEDPSGARKDSVVSLYLGPVVGGVCSLLFYGAAALVWRYRTRFQKDYEARRGRTVLTTVNSDGTVTHTTRSSVPVFRWTGYFFAALGIAVWFGGVWFALHELDVNKQAFRFSHLAYLVVMGALLILGAFLSLRHSNYLQRLEDSYDRK